MFFRSLVTLSSVVALSLAAVACSGAPSSDPTASSSAQAVSGTPVDPAFAGCDVDSDCVAVPQAGCCSNGWRAAVNVDAVDAYDAANACTQQIMCPMFIVDDTRVAQCNWDTKVCVMIAPEKIDCGDVHTCPDGYTCNRGSERGTCVQGAQN